jgi:hypothetical protein
VGLLVLVPQRTHVLTTEALLHDIQFIGYPGDPTQYPVPFATRFGVLHVRPEGARLLPVVVDRATVAAFLDARRLFGWDQGPAKSVIGEPIARVSSTQAA